MRFAMKNNVFLLLYFISIIGCLIHVRAKADNVLDYKPNYMGVEQKDFFRVDVPENIAEKGDISVPQNLLRNGMGELLYSDEQYIVIVESMNVREKDSKKEITEADKRNEMIQNRGGSFRTGFYDSRTLDPVFYLPFRVNQVEFNKKSGLFALSYDSLTTDKIYREVYIVLLNPVSRKGAAMSIYTHWIRGDEMSWNGNELEVRISGGPLRGTVEAFRFVNPFLSHPVIVRSIDTEKESKKGDYWEKNERRVILKTKEFKKIWSTSNSIGCNKISFGTGMTSNSIAFFDDTGVINHLDFDKLKYDALEIPDKGEIGGVGAAPNQTIWVITRDRWNKPHNLLNWGREGLLFSYECPQNIHLSASGKEAWGGNYVFDVTSEGLLRKFEAPKGKRLIGVDFENREILLQDSDADDECDNIDVWKDRMMPSAYDLDTGKLKLNKCSWFEVGAPDSSSVYNNGCEVGLAPKGWRMGVHHDDYRRMNGLVSTLSIHFPSGKTIHYGDGVESVLNCTTDRSSEETADKLAALYSCGKEAKSMLLLYDGLKGGQAVIFDAKTLKSHEIAHWMGGSPLWLEAKQWLFVPRMGYYDVIHIDDKGEGKAVFSFYYAKRGYAIVLPNGLYAGSPGCESLLQYRNETGGMERLSRWRNRPGEVLEALGGDPDSITLLKDATARWHRKIQFDPSTPEPSSSELPMVSVKQLPSLFASSPSVSLPISVTATARPINQYSLKINGVTTNVPLENSVTPGQSREVNCKLELADGTNWIEIRAIDANGIMGSAVRFRLIGQGISAQKTLYLVSLGVSSYKDNSLNLRYAAKDAVDFTSAMKALYGDNIRVLTLTDATVTRNSLKQVREFLTNGPKTGDSVILYCAGHGVLDEQWRYVFASHEFDPDRPADTGILMDDLKGCLTASSARNRLLLMDTCHSGMIGEEDEVKLARLGVELPNGVSLAMARGMKVKAIPQMDAEQKKRYIEEMFSLSFGTEGMSILGASGGGEFAQESGEWNNGVFTRCLIEGLRDELADENADGTVNIGELKNYIARKVPEMTKGQQKPSLVSYDPDQEFAVARSATPKQEKLTWVLDMSDDGINPANYIEARTGADSSRSVDNVDVLKNMFADELDYQYIKGRRASRSEVMDDIEKGWNKWPTRSYELLAAGRNGKTVEVVYSYSLSNYETNKEAKGFTKETWTLGDHGKIAVWREQVSRRDAPALSPEILNAPNNSGRKYSLLEYIECRQNGYVNILAGLFADQVDYQYIKGKKASREDVVKDIAAGFQKWIQRRYQMVAAGKKGNTVEVIYSFSLLNPNGPKGKYGSVEPISGYTKETWTLDEQGKIVKWRESISKKEAPSLSSGLFVICL